MDYFQNTRVKWTCVSNQDLLAGRMSPALHSLVERRRPIPAV